jgi:SAM-dependent methyltransferase
MANNEIGLETGKCPKCQSSKFRHLYSTPDFLYGVKGQFSVAQCEDCGIQYQNPRPAPKMLGRLYPNDYAPHRDPRTSITRDKAGLLLRVLRALNPLRAHHHKIGLNPDFVENGHLIELGCASGGRLARLRNDGWQNLYGIELSENAASLASAAGFDVRCGLIEDELRKFPDEYFDAVISSMVMEHLYDPFTLIDLVARKLKPGGQFLFSTIVRNSFDARFYGKYWAGYDLPRHMVFYTTDELESYLSEKFLVTRVIRQSAYGDFYRSSSWRKAYGEGRLIDKLITSVKPGIFTDILGVMMAKLNGSCRVSIELRKR